jgi:hypothetical protein
VKNGLAHKNKILNGDTMKELFIIIVSVLLSSSLLCQFFMDYKKERLLIASFELITSIMWAACCACAICHCTLQVLA